MTDLSHQKVQPRLQPIKFGFLTIFFKNLCMPIFMPAKRTCPPRLAVSTVSPPSPYANPAKPQPVSPPGPSWLHVPVRIRPTSPARPAASTLLQDRSSIPPHTRNFSSKSNSRAPYRPVWVRCVTFGASGMSLLFSSSGMQHKFRPTFRFLEVKHLVWYAQSNSVLYAQEILLKKSHPSISNNELLSSPFCTEIPRSDTFILIRTHSSKKFSNFCLSFSPFRSSPYKNEILQSNSVFLSRFEAKILLSPQSHVFLPPRGTQTADNQYQQHSRPNQSISTLYHFKLFLKEFLSLALSFHQFPPKSKSTQKGTFLRAIWATLHIFGGRGTVCSNFKPIR